MNCRTEAGQKNKKKYLDVEAAAFDAAAFFFGLLLISETEKRGKFPFQMETEKRI